MDTFCPVCKSHLIDISGEVFSFGTTRTIYRCSCCTHAFVWPVPSNKELMKYYSSSSQEHTDSFERSYRERLNKIDLFCKKNKVDFYKKNVMEIGPGSIGILGLLCKGSSYIAVEPCQESQQTLRALGQEKGILVYCYNSLYDVPEKTSVDLVVSTSCLEHFDDIDVFMKKSIGFLRQSGFFVLSVPDQSVELPRLGFFKKDKLAFCETHLHSFSMQSIVFLAAKYKLCPLACKRLISPSLRRGVIGIERSYKNMFTQRKIYSARFLFFHILNMLNIFILLMLKNVSRDYSVVFLFKNNNLKS